MEPGIILHGGARKSQGERDEFEVNFVKDYAAKTYKLLKKGMSAVDAIEIAIVLMENNPTFDAGTGSYVQYDRKVRMTAVMMDSQRVLPYGVVNVENVKNPILGAKLLRDIGQILGGSEATYFLRKHGFEHYNPIRPESYEFPKPIVDGPKPGYLTSPTTVGAVAIDIWGNIAAATSTGGVGGETPGRIGDVATTAATYANKVIGISSSGKGEYNHAVGLAQAIRTRVADGLELEDAVKKTFDELKELGSKAGVIAIHKKYDEQIIIKPFFNTETMIWASMLKDELKHTFS
ncbi:isoaspartyl peptidase/L-asparaginase [Candidatus Woesearchaeota archaeon]|nr:isoaspartyl peptidase/L-asparaginase [Candidatus Woesearchaeota archaeon]